MEIQGRIKFIGQTQTFGQNGFQKREVVIVTEEQYPQSIIFDFTQDNCHILDNFQVNQLVKISFNIRGREWTNPQGETKYFNTLQGWRISTITTPTTTAIYSKSIPTTCSCSTTNSSSSF